MNNARTPLIILSFLVIASLLMSVYFVYQPDYVEIIYRPQSQDEEAASEKASSSSRSKKAVKTSSQASRKTSSKTSSKSSRKASSKSSQKTSSKATSSKVSSNTSHEAPMESEPPDLETSSERFSSFDDFPDSSDDWWSSEENSRPDSKPTSSWGDESLESNGSSGWNPEPPPPEDSFDEVLELLRLFGEQYGVPIQINLEVDVLDPQYGFFTDAREALAFAGIVEDFLQKLEPEFLQALTAKNYPLELFLTRQNPSGENVVLELLDGAAQIIIQYVEESVTEAVYKKISKLFDQIMEESGGLETVYAEFVVHNPPDFVYGTFAPEYVFNNPELRYFLSIAAQSSVSEDRAAIFAKSRLDSFWRAQLKETDPLAKKLQALDDSIQAYILS